MKNINRELEYLKYLKNRRLTFHVYIVHGKNGFAEGSKILLDTDLKMILLEP